MVELLPHRLSPRVSRKPSLQYLILDGESDPTALEPTDELIHRQRIPYPVWNGLTNRSGIAGQCYWLPNLYVPLLAEYHELSDRKI